MAQTTGNKIFVYVYCHIMDAKQSDGEVKINKQGFAKASICLVDALLHGKSKSLKMSTGMDRCHKRAANSD